MRVILEHIKSILQTIAMLIFAFWRVIPHLTQLLIILMVADLLLGLIIAIRDKKLSALTAYRGVTKKVVALILVGLAWVLDIYIGSAIGVRLVDAATAFYLVPELISISRNAAILEVPVFSEMKVVLNYFQKRIDTGGGTYVEGEVNVNEGDFLGRDKHS